MAPMSRKELNTLDKASGEYRIRFREFLKREKWPDFHTELLEHVTDLGSRKYSSYAADPADTENALWKAELKAQADKLITLVWLQSNRKIWSFVAVYLLL